MAVKHLLHVVFWCLGISITFPAEAAATLSLMRDPVSVCHTPASQVPTFQEPECALMSPWKINPQKTHLWVKAAFQIPDRETNIDTTIDAEINTPADAEIPLGLFISAKAASEVYLNGMLIGRNGSPSADPRAEIPGAMDIVFHIPDSTLIPGENQLILRLSGHHSLIPLSYPVHILEIGPYRDPREHMLAHYLPTFLPFGVLVAGAVYFGFLGIRRASPATGYLVPLIAFFAAAQLLTEALRSLVAYQYPMQDARLIAILAFGIATGICLVLHVIDRFLPNKKKTASLLALTVMSGSIALIEGYDPKTWMAILAPAVMGTVIAGRAAIKGNKNALRYALGLAAFSAALLIDPDKVMETYLYYIEAILLLFLFASQVQALTKAKHDQALLKAQADHLQLALDEAEQKQKPATIQVKDKGAVTLLHTDQLVYCRGARDYVELILDDNRTLLHNASLTELEKDLPGTFLRVHRSFLVNTSHIERLEREPSGSGVLGLKGGSSVPVSRRIMPRVRKALA